MRLVCMTKISNSYLQMIMCSQQIMTFSRLQYENSLKDDVTYETFMLHFKTPLFFMPSKFLFLPQFSEP